MGTIKIEEALSKGDLNFRPSGGGGGYGLVFRDVTYDVPDRDGDRVKARRVYRAGLGAEGSVGGSNARSPLRDALSGGIGGIGRQMSGLGLGLAYTRGHSRRTRSGDRGAQGRLTVKQQYVQARSAAQNALDQANSNDPSGLRIVDGVTGNVRPGQLVAILGASGSVSQPVAAPSPFALL